MMQIFRLIIVTVVTGGLVWLLGRTVFEGIKSGTIRHTDSTRVCRRDKNPVGFWALVVLFCGFIVLLWGVWGCVVFDTVQKMK